MCLYPSICHFCLHGIAVLLVTYRSVLLLSHDVGFVRSCNTASFHNSGGSQSNGSCKAQKAKNCVNKSTTLSTINRFHLGVARCLMAPCRNLARSTATAPQSIGQCQRRKTREHLVTRGQHTRSKDATRGSWPYYWEQGRY